MKAVWSFIINTLVAAALYLSYKYLQEKQSFFQLGFLKREIELQQLKLQLNPHFLFNALNNIYSYTLHSSKFGNELIIKLSELMRYIVESADKDEVPLEEEISFIENYIIFEQERLGDRCFINYSKNIYHTERMIAPLLLFPFIENAFKYGANTTQKSSVEILLIDSKNALTLTVKNKVLNTKVSSTKKGLYNATRRLDLLYMDRYNLRTVTENEEYVAELVIEFS